MTSSVAFADEWSQWSQRDDWLARTARNAAGFWEHMARAKGRYWVHWDDIWAADAQSPSPIPNTATLLQPLHSARVAALVARMDGFYAQRPGGPWMLWSAWPSPDLQPWGFRLIGDMPLLIRRPGGAWPPAPAELRIVEVTDAATLADFERAFIAGYPVPDMRQAPAGALLDERILGGPLRLWLGYLDGRPVTTARSLADQAVNGIFAVSTLPTERGHGYGTAITARAIAASPLLPAVLEASDLGYPVYQRLGFRDIARSTRWVKARK